MHMGFLQVFCGQERRWHSRVRSTSLCGHIAGAHAGTGAHWCQVHYLNCIVSVPFGLICSWASADLILCYWLCWTWMLSALTPDLPLDYSSALSPGSPALLIPTLAYHLTIPLSAICVLICLNVTNLDYLTLSWPASAPTGPSTCVLLISVLCTSQCTHTSAGRNLYWHSCHSALRQSPIALPGLLSQSCKSPISTL